jgi:hypothetical protein
MTQHHCKSIALFLMAALFLISCAGTPDSKSTVRSDNRIRAYERFKSDHLTEDEDDLSEPGIYLYKKDLYVVISLTDSGTDRYPEWACDRLLTTLYGYRAAAQSMVSDEKFFALVLEFEIDEVIDGKYENLARIKVKEKTIENFLANLDSGE